MVLTYKWLRTGGSGRSGFQPENNKVTKGSESSFWVAGRNSGLLLSPLKLFSEVCVEMKRSKNGRITFVLPPASPWVSRPAFEDPVESGRRYPECWEMFILGDTQREWYPSCSRSLFFKWAIKDSRHDLCWAKVVSHQFGPLSFLSYPSNLSQRQESGLPLDRTSIGARSDAYLKIELSMARLTGRTYAYPTGAGTLTKARHCLHLLEHECKFEVERSTYLTQVVQWGLCASHFYLKHWASIMMACKHSLTSFRFRHVRQAFGVTWVYDGREYGDEGRTWFLRRAGLLELDAGVFGIARRDKPQSRGGTFPEECCRKI